VGSKGCTATTRAGKPCGMPAICGTKRCNSHTPGRASAAGKVGGPRRRLLDPSKLFPFEPPQTAQEFGRLISTTAIELRGAKLDARTANALSALSSAFLGCLNHGAIEDRLTELEKQFAEREERK